LHDGRSRMIANQTQASLPLRKNLQAQVVVAMLKNQREVLRSFGLLDGKQERVFRERLKEPGDFSPESCHVYYRRLFVPSFPVGVEQPERYFDLAHEVLRVMMKERLYSCGLEPSLGWFGPAELEPERLYGVLSYPFYPIMDWLVYEAFRYHKFLALDEDRFAEVLLDVLPCVFPVKSGELSLKVAIEVLTERICFCYDGEARQLVFPEIFFGESLAEPQSRSLL
jgi:CRISP-associated protein Cas1